MSWLQANTRVALLQALVPESPNHRPTYLSVARYFVGRDPGETTRISPEHIRRPSKRLLSVSSSKGEKLRRNTPKKNAEFFQNEDHEELDSRKGEDAVSPPALPLVRKQQKRKKEDARKESSYCRGKTASSTLATSSSSTSTSTPLSSNECKALLGMTIIGIML